MIVRVLKCRLFLRMMSWNITRWYIQWYYTDMFGVTVFIFYNIYSHRLCIICYIIYYSCAGHSPLEIRIVYSSRCHGFGLNLRYIILLYRCVLYIFTRHRQSPVILCIRSFATYYHRTLSCRRSPQEACVRFNHC